MRINSNIPSLMAQRQLDRTTKAISRALSQLASGKRIQEARDDASGLAISNKLESQQRSLAQNIRNMNDAMSMLNVADQAFSGLLEITQRMRELAVQSSQGTLSSNDRGNLDGEFQSLLAEYSRIVESTSFNGVQLLEGGIDDTNLQVGVEKGDSFSLNLDSSRSSDIFQTANGNGSFTLTTTTGIDSSAANFNMEIADFNADGENDLLQKEGSYVTIRWGEGNGVWSSITTLTSSATTGITNRPMVSDIDNDGDLDVMVRSGTSVSAYLNQGGKSFAGGPANTLNGTAVNSFRVGDLNGDHIADVIDVFQNGLNYYYGVYLGNGSGTFTLTSSTLIGPSASNALGLADFDGDGDLDAITAHGIGSYKVAFNDGSGVMTTSSTILAAPAVSLVSDIETADLDGDGDIDFVARHTNTIYEYFNSGNGTMTGVSTIVGSATPDFSLGDIDGDGYVDIAVSSSGQNSIGFYRGSASGFSSWTSMSSSTTPNGIQLADLDEDGALDLFVGHSGSDHLAYYHGDTDLNSAEASDLSLLTQSSSQNLLSILDRSIENLISRRASVGAQVNRLEFAENEAMMRRENLQAAKSQLLDVDVAEITAELTRSQILQQAQMSVLAQANFSLRAALELLR